MQLIYKLQPDWPKLAWVAKCALSQGAVEIFHGPMVETARDWCVEGVWNGSFAEGDFDTGKLLFGSGLRRRGDKIIFVPSSTLVDRIWHVRTEDTLYVANTLAGVLALSSVKLRRDVDYPELIKTVEYPGFNVYVRPFPANPFDVNVQYFHHLCWDGRELAETPRPLPKHNFTNFAIYRRFLADTTAALCANGHDQARRNNVTPITTVSSGYDSVAVSVLARDAGCRQAFTIADSTSTWRGSDCGDRIAERLGLDCKVYRQKHREYPDEIAFIGAVGRFGAINFSLFDYPEPLALLFTGSYGDKVWDRRPHDFTNPSGDTDMLLEEFRLRRGIFNCVVPWWAPDNFAQINALGVLPEMLPWALHTQYDRPIPRRIAEEAGVPRSWFGNHKKNVSAEQVFKWPFTPAAQTSFSAYLQTLKLSPPPAALIGCMRALAKMDHLINRNIIRKVLPRRFYNRKTIFRWDRYVRQNVLYTWANEELAKCYQVNGDIKPA